MEVLLWLLGWLALGAVSFTVALVLDSYRAGELFELDKDDYEAIIKASILGPLATIIAVCSFLYIGLGGMLVAYKNKEDKEDDTA